MDTAPTVGTTNAPNSGIVDIGDGWYRIWATATISAATTDITGYLQLGTVGADTGTLHMTAPQFEQSSYPGRLVIAGNATTATNADQPTHTAEGFPIKSVSISWDYTTPLDPDLVGTGATLIRWRTGSDGVICLLLGGSGLGSVRTIIGNGSTFADLQSGSATDWVAGQTYHMEIRWSQGNAWILRDNIVIKSQTDGLVPMPIAPGNTVYLGWDGTDDQALGSVSNLKIRRA